MKISENLWLYGIVGGIIGVMAVLMIDSLDFERRINHLESTIFGSSRCLE